MESSFGSRTCVFGVSPIPQDRILSFKFKFVFDGRLEFRLRHTDDKVKLGRKKTRRKVLVTTSKRNTRNHLGFDDIKSRRVEYLRTEEFIEKCESARMQIEDCEPSPPQAVHRSDISVTEGKVAR